MTARDPRPLVAHVVHRFDTGGLENGVVDLINRLPARRRLDRPFSPHHVLRARIAQPSNVLNMRRFSMDGVVADYGDVHNRLLTQAASRGALQRA